MRNKARKLISFALVSAMVLSLVPSNLPTYAAENDSAAIEVAEEGADEQPVVEDQAEETSTEVSVPSETPSEEKTEDSTEVGIPTTEETTEAVTEEKTEENKNETVSEEATSEETTEEATEETTEEEKEEETITEPVPTFDTIYDGVSVAGLDFSSCELLIATEDSSIFTADTDVVSEYNGIYLTRYPDPTQTMNAYTYYYTRASLVEVNSSVKATDVEGTEEGSDDSAEEDSGDDGDVPQQTDDIEVPEVSEDIANEGHGEADLSNLNNSDDAFSNVDGVGVANYSGYIALIDTGASEGVKKSVSVIGDGTGDDNGHGTKMARAILEANPNANIISIKALGSDAVGSVQDVYTAIEYAINANVSVINLSMASITTADSELLRSVIAEAQNRGIVVVASAGNNGSNASYYTPANIAGVKTIGACDNNGNRVSLSNYGSVVDYYVVADSTSLAAAKFSGYAVMGLDKVEEMEDVFTREYVESEKKSEDNEEKASDGDADKEETEEEEESGWVVRRAVDQGEEPLRSFTEKILLQGATLPNEVKVWGSAWGLGASQYNTANFQFDATSVSNLDGSRSTDNGYYTIMYESATCPDGHSYMAPLYIGSGSVTINPDTVGTFTYNRSEYGYSVYRCVVEIANKPHSDNWQRVQLEVGIIEKSEGTHLALHKGGLGGAPYENIMFAVYGWNGSNYTWIGYMCTDSNGNARVIYDGSYAYQNNLGSSVIPQDITDVCGKDHYYLRELGHPHISNSGYLWFGSPYSSDYSDANENITWIWSSNVPSTLSESQMENGSGYCIRCANHSAYHSIDCLGDSDYNNGSFSAIWDGAKSSGRFCTINGDNTLYNGNIRYVAVIKKDDKNHPLADAEFKFYREDNGQQLFPIGGSINGIVCTDSNGVAVICFDDNYSGGVKAVEVTPPPGDWCLVPSNWNKTVTALSSYPSYDEAITNARPVVNVPPSYISIKKDIISGNTTGIDFSKIKYHIYRKDGNNYVELNQEDSPGNYLSTRSSDNTTTYFKVGVEAGTTLYITEDSTSATAAGFDTSVIPLVKTGNGNYAPYNIYTTKYAVVTKSDNNSVSVFVNDGTPVPVCVEKSSAVANTGYSLKATYGIYTDSDCKDSSKVGEVTTNSTTGISNTLDVSSYMTVNNQTGKYNNKIFYAKELSTDEPEFVVNTHIESVTVTSANNASNPAKFYSKEPPKTYVYLEKGSADKTCTNNNPNYDLTGAEYKVFRSENEAQAALSGNDYSAAIGTFTTDKDGKTTAINVSDYMIPKADGTFDDTNFYIVESKQANMGYVRSVAISRVTVTPSNIKSNPAKVDVTDVPVKDPFALTAVKVDSFTNSVTELAGVEFKVSFYPENVDIIRSAAWLKANSTPTITDTITTTLQLDGSIKAFLNKEYPRGFLVIDEINYPSNYTMDGLKVYLNGDTTKDIADNMVFIMDAELTSDNNGNENASYKGITWYPNDAVSYRELASKGTKFEENNSGTVDCSLTFANTQIRGNIELTKYDETTGKPMEGVKFKITNTTTKEVHYLYTDKDGYATTKVNDYGSNMNYYDNVSDYDGTDATVWFGIDNDGNYSKPEDWIGFPADIPDALPAGTYKVREMRCTANAGMQLESEKEVTISTNHQLTNIFDTDATASDNKIWNTVKPIIHTQAKDVQTGSQTMAQSGSNIDWTDQTIEDTIYYEKLRAKETEYTFLTELMVVDKDGNVEPYTKNGVDYRQITPLTTPLDYSKSLYEITGEITVNIEHIDPTGLEEEQKKFVVYESLYYGHYDTLADLDKAIADNTIVTRYPEYDADDDMDFLPVEHKDKDDTFQTVTPGDIHTTVVNNVSLDRVAKAESTKITDRIFFTGLTVGDEYTISGKLVVKEGTDWTNIKYDPKDPNADADGFVTNVSNTNNAASGQNASTTNNSSASGQQATGTTGNTSFDNNPNKAYFLKDADGNYVTASRTFIATQSEGYIDVEFTVDASLLGGKTTVAFEELSYNGVIIALHNDLSDEDEAVHFPAIGTTTRNAEAEVGKALDKDDEAVSKMVSASKDSSFIDAIHFSNLLANRTYKAKGILMDKATGKEMLDASGKKIVGEVTFKTNSVGEIVIDKSPDAVNYVLADGTVMDMSSDHADYMCNGDVEVLFDGYDFTNLANKTGVVFEEIYLVKEGNDTFKDDKGNVIEVGNEILVGEHKDINDIDQFIYYTQIGTKATDTTTNTKVVPYNTDTVIEDVVSFKNVIPNKEYTLTATLVVKNDKSGKYKDGDKLLDKDGKVITVTHKFTPKTANGEEVVKIPVNTAPYKDMEIVVFEGLENRFGIEIATHNDLSDEDQTLEVPGGGTKAKDKATDDEVSSSQKSVTIVDTIIFRNLEISREYTAKGVLYDKATKEPIKDANGNEITNTVKFKPTSKNGTVNVEFTIDASLLAGKTIVVFEDIMVNGKTVFIHHDIEDNEQSVYIPKIGTSATTKDGQKSTTASKKTTIVDKCSFSNLVIGKEYKISGVLYDKSTGKKLVVNGQNVTAEKTFTPTTTDGYVELEFTFDSTGLSTDVVVFEYLYHKDVEVATHTNIEDKGQTVTITPPNAPPKTGMTVFFVLLGLMAAGGIGMFLSKKKRDITE
jgi:Subtilisin-like serine proteases